MRMGMYVCVCIAHVCARTCTYNYYIVQYIHVLRTYRLLAALRLCNTKK